MRVLWFTNIPVGDMIAEDRMGSGGWMDALLRVLQGTPGLTLGVCCVASGLTDHTFEQDGITYYSVRMPKTRKRRWTSYRDDDDRNRDQVLKLCANVVRQFKPTVIHIHGTERAYGLLATQGLDCPVLLSIQGLVSVYASWVNTFGNYSLFQVLRFHGVLHTLRGFGPLWDYAKLSRQGKRETEIIALNHFFNGRTQWDRAHVLTLNPKAKYFKINELLRPNFFANAWKLACIKRHSLFFANGRGPRRNVECLLRAAALLVADYPNLRLRIGGTNGREDRYSLAMTKLSERLGLGAKVEFLGVLPAERVAEELRSAHAFVLPSRIENSANSLCEAQLLGVPSIAGYVGGTPTLIQDGQTGLLVPSDDEALFAAAIRSVFEDDDFALKLSQQSRSAALQRHDSEQIRLDVLHAYRTMVGETLA